MRRFLEGDLYAGLSGISVGFGELNLGHGILLSRAYARLMSSFMMSFRKPTREAPYGEPWSAAEGGREFEVSAQLFIPRSVEDLGLGSRFEILELVLALVRLRGTPGSSAPVVSNMPFEAVPEADRGAAEIVAWETDGRGEKLSIRAGRAFSNEYGEWVRDHWPRCAILVREKKELLIAIEALDQVPFLRDPDLAIVAIWAALEALFSPSQSELRFRISSLIAAYLEPPGETRLALQKKVAKLYDARSKAVHGRGLDSPELLVESMELLRRILIETVNAGTVPDREQLDRLLFGASS